MNKREREKEREREGFENKLNMVGSTWQVPMISTSEPPVQRLSQYRAMFTSDTKVRRKETFGCKWCWVVARSSSENKE